MSATTGTVRPSATGAFDRNAGIGQTAFNQSIKSFAASVSTAAVVFGIQIVAFLILSGNWKLKRSKKQDKPTDRQSLFHKI
jgi:ABC-type methionine transport system permease subunit